MLSMGIDLGGSGFRIGLFDVETGMVHGEIVTRRHQGGLHPSEVLPALREVLTSFSWKGPIGMGFPGVVEGNQIQTAPNLGSAWCSISLDEELSPYHDGRFTLLNDADAVAIGEARFGHGHEGHACVLTLTVGTGLGTTVHRNGVLEANLEFGRLPHPTRSGVLEEHLSGRVRQEENLSIPAWCERFQEGLTFLEQLVKPSLIIVYGGIVEHWTELAPQLKTEAELVSARLLSSAGPLGAAWCAVHWA
jgi:polyphosphate glucokinase